MRTKIAQVLVVFSLVCAIGGPWAFLQSVAWVGMVMNYAQDSTLTEALQKTFDGQHPCKLCKVVQKGKQQESRQEARVPTFKLELFCEPKAVRLEVPPLAEALFLFAESHSDHSDSPPVPPPRRA